ncbi:unnamed protein product [Protopolystoma xenopodis]|uniref:Uncharacterized protein n=1 Tax=Protopolystoma xenopodis TaxID=117903 RepID=A0A448X2D9_9PLAT|nr:unnamed protein product [Protopolystoma xenopodis]
MINAIEIESPNIGIPMTDPYEPQVTTTFAPNRPDSHSFHHVEEVIPAVQSPTPSVFSPTSSSSQPQLSFVASSSQARMATALVSDFVIVHQLVTSLVDAVSDDKAARVSASKSLDDYFELPESGEQKNKQEVALLHDAIQPLAITLGEQRDTESSTSSPMHLAFANCVPTAECCLEQEDQPNTASGLIKPKEQDEPKRMGQSDDFATYLSDSSSSLSLSSPTSTVSLATPLSTSSTYSPVSGHLGGTDNLGPPLPMRKKQHTAFTQLPSGLYQFLSQLFAVIYT